MLVLAKLELDLRQFAHLVENPLLRRCLLQHGNVCEQVYAYLLNVIQSLFGEVEGDIQQTEGTFQPRPISGHVRRDQALLFQHGGEGAGAFVTQKMPHILSRLRAPKLALVRQHPAEHHLLHILNRILQEQRIPIGRQERRLPRAMGIADWHLHTLVCDCAEHRLHHVRQLCGALAPDDDKSHAAGRVAAFVQFDHFFVQVDTSLFRLVPQYLVIAASDMEWVVWVCALIHDADVAPPRVRHTSLELRVHCVDFTVRALLREQRLIKETRKTVERVLQLFGRDFKHVVSKITQCVGISAAAILVDEFMVFPLFRKLFRAGEQHVLEKMCKAWKVFALMAHADIDAKRSACFVAAWIRTNNRFQPIFQLDEGVFSPV
mmetsp:Transcript_83429/g.241059  ORF Transcript_83429/g.241059 Transcript_83429/m.241059 type:complete len:376 (-) Transcript_83429:108-1235(-)